MNSRKKRYKFRGFLAFFPTNVCRHLHVQIRRDDQKAERRSVVEGRGHKCIMFMELTTWIRWGRVNTYADLSWTWTTHGRTHRSRLASKGRWLGGGEKSMGNLDRLDGIWECARGTAGPLGARTSAGDDDAEIEVCHDNLVTLRVRSDLT